MRIEFDNMRLPAREFDARNGLPGFETLERARTRQARLVNLLETAGRPNSTALASALAGCSTTQRCRSAACPVCLRWFRIRFGGTIAELVYGDADVWCTLTLVPPTESYKVGKLRRFDWHAAKERLRKQLSRKLPGAAVMGGFDFDVQHFDRKSRSPRWRPHIYCAVRGATKKQIRKALKRFYPADADTPVPLIVKRLTKSPLKVGTYAFKSRFHQRFPCRDREGNSDTRYEPLTDGQSAELALALDAMDFKGRQILFGVTRRQIVRASMSD